MNILKLLIPRSEKKEIREIESWTVMWKIAGSVSGSGSITLRKVFITKEEAKEFENQLNECARFISASISSDLYKN